MLQTFQQTANREDRAEQRGANYIGTDWIGKKKLGARLFFFRGAKAQQSENKNKRKHVRGKVIEEKGMKKMDSLGATIAFQSITSLTTTPDLQISNYTWHTIAYYTLF